MRDYDRNYRQDHRHEPENPFDNGHHHEQEQEPLLDPMHDHHKKHKKACTATLSEDISITTPIEIKAYAKPHDVEIKCKGHDITEESSCKPNTKKFTIRQMIQVKIPLECVAECEIGHGKVDFGDN